mmetsp:Transcript_35967/g.76746  ORF Transcript_35967/g.76746 Transcript_35967/m.76746 type:complete len:365 (-) Transcript_35967:3434-4528(-)
MECPDVQLLDPVSKIRHPGAERLQGRVREEPTSRNLALVERFQDSLLLLADHDEALNALLQELDGSAHGTEQITIPLDLLEQANLQRRNVRLISLGHLLSVDVVRELFQQGIACVHHHVATGSAAATATARTTLHGEDGRKHALGVLDRGRDLRIDMLAKRLWRLVHWQILHVVAVGSERVVLRDVVGRERGELELRNESLWTEELCHVRPEHAIVGVLSNATAVVGFRDEVPHSVPGDVVRVLVEVHRDDVLADIEIGVIEVVPNVPAEHLEFPALEENSVEPTKREEELLVLGRFLDSVVLLFGHGHDEPGEIRLDTLGRLRRHLDAILEELDRELGRGRGGHEDSEILVRLRLEGTFDNLL